MSTYEEPFQKVIALEKGLKSIGRKLRQVHGSIDFSEKTDSFDLLTTSDTQTELEIKALLQTVDSKTPVVGEELGGDDSGSKYWLIDPIDGTIHFVRGMPFCSIMVALIETGKPVASVIYNFMTDEYFYAARGQGAFRNGRRIRVSQRGLDKSVLLIESRLHLKSTLEVIGDFASRYKMMNTMCAGNEYAMVASGRVEARVTLEPFGKSYDFAPGALLVQEAGGVVKDLQGHDYTIDTGEHIAAASTKLYEAIQGTIRSKTDNTGVDISIHRV